MRLGTALAIRGPLADVAEQATLVDALGYDSIWVPEVAGRDALVACAAIAPHVSAARLATGIVPMPVRSPVTLAMGAAALSEVCEGRFDLGVGMGHRETLRDWYAAAPLTLAGAEEHLRIVRSILHDGAVEHDGDHYRVSFRLRGAHPPSPPRIVLASLRRRSAAMAGRVADGIVMNWVTPGYARGIAEVFRESARRAGRDPGKLEVACFVPACVTDDVDAARSELGRQIAAYGVLRAYRGVLEECGLGAEMDAVSSGGPDAVSPRLADALGAHGPVDHVIGVLERYREAGVTLPILVPYPVGDDPWASMSATWSMLADD